MVNTPPWKLAADLPWHALKSPLSQWAALPSFLIGEYLFLGCAALTLYHALSHDTPDDRRRHLLVWIGALIAGTANDMIFMALPLVDNFWQAQATIMLTPRLPLYIPCVYICFMYLPVVSVWRLGLGPLPRAALSGLAGSLFYAPYDIVGAKFLWWTWHDTDRPIAQRILGVPVGSTLWVITFTATFAFLLNLILDREARRGETLLSGRTARNALITVAAFSSVLMVVQMTALQQLDGGAPGVRSLLAAVILYGAVAAAGMRFARPWPQRPQDRPLNRGVVTYFAVLISIVALFDPATHKSASLHQTYGPCHVEAKDLAGNTRYQFLCAQDYDEDFDFSCVDRLPANGTEWYTVCGRPFPSRLRWLLGVGGLGALGMLLYSFLLGSLRRTR